MCATLGKHEYDSLWVCVSHIYAYTHTQSEINNLTGQLEDLDRKQSTSEKSAKNLNEQLEELREQLQEETRAKIAGSNKNKQLADEIERLNAQLEDEEEAKNSLQSKLVQLNQQVGVASYFTQWVWSNPPHTVH